MSAFVYFLQYIHSGCFKLHKKPFPVRKHGVKRVSYCFLASHCGSVTGGRFPILLGIYHWASEKIPFSKWASNFSITFKDRYLHNLILKALYCFTIITCLLVENIDIQIDLKGMFF